MTLVVVVAVLAVAVTALALSMIALNKRIAWLLDLARLDQKNFEFQARLNEQVEQELQRLAKVTR